MLRRQRKQERVKGKMMAGDGRTEEVIDPQGGVGGGGVTGHVCAEENETKQNKNQNELQAHAAE